MGSGHEEPKGKIFFFWLLAVLPWSLILPVVMLVRAKYGLEQAKQNNGFTSFAIWWALSPLILFTLSSNILPTYVLPGTPAVAVLLAIFWKKKDIIWMSIAALVVPVALIAATWLLHTGQVADNSDKSIFQEIDLSVPTYYLETRTYSGQYYSSGQAKAINTLDDIKQKEDFYMVVLKEWQQRWKNIAGDKVTCSEPQAESDSRVALLCQFK
ncbi:hypothetical protein JCM19239_3881 [Vibrio variabilis]|uniref:Uncharacterized protein n=1 Tax=Vibrio variabilis TaxID=990271 RepID=A0ABQ0J5V6_9VIBR|nr:hypothetical protein JCM19239_3881 [Vibrio variabilis]